MERENTLSQIETKKKLKQRKVQLRTGSLSVSHMSIIHLIEFSTEVFFLQ